MQKKWIDEIGGVDAAAAMIAPAVRIAIGRGGVVSFVKDVEIDERIFEKRCENSALEGVYAGDQQDVDLERVYADVQGYGANEDSESIDALGVEGLGFFVLAKSKGEAVDKENCLLEGRAYAFREVKDASGWRRLSGKIAVVTGSAQGFGDGIAREMIDAGAHVVIADLNDELAAQNAAQINESVGEERAFAVKVDVSDEESVARMMRRTVLHFGGLDVFVSNAGVLKAGSLEEMTLRDFDFVTKINYTAFFICTKYASRVMKLQHRFDPAYTMDIVQINSKSGLEGSNKNFAYAGGKFGGIGLVASFAKELVNDGIKVNAICPGNYYEGPLWSDPDRGLFKQYLLAGKVKNATTIEDVREYYMAQVPMGRGCYPRDVARAIFYCMEQEYETGQAIPVTGGQVMLH